MPSPYYPFMSLTGRGRYFFSLTSQRSKKKNNNAWSQVRKMTATHWGGSKYSGVRIGIYRTKSSRPIAPTQSLICVNDLFQFCAVPKSYPACEHSLSLTALHVRHRDFLVHFFEAHSRHDFTSDAMFHAGGLEEFIINEFSFLFQF